MSDIVFRRIRGRIVPIRKKKKDEGNNYRNLKLWGGGVAANISGMAVGRKLIKSIPETKVEDINKFKKDFGSTLEKHKVGVFKMEGDFAPGAFSKMHDGAEIGFNEGKGIYIGRGKESALVHELGHIVSSTKKFSFNKILKNQIVDFNDAKTLGKKYFKLGKILISRPYLSLGAEAEASAYAFKHAFKSGGFAKVAKFSKVLVPAYLSYALIGAGSAMAQFAIGRGIYDAFKTKDKKNGK
jgi:hypothetical protein